MYKYSVSDKSYIFYKASIYYVYRFIFYLSEQVIFDRVFK